MGGGGFCSIRVGNGTLPFVGEGSLAKIALHVEGLYLARRKLMVKKLLFEKS